MDNFNSESGKIMIFGRYLIGINLPGRNLPIFEKGGKFLPGNLKRGQVMERRLKKKSYNLTMTMTEIL